MVECRVGACCFGDSSWSEDVIKRCFGACCEVVEVDPRCLTGDNFGPLRVLLELNHYLDLPSEIWISATDGVSRMGCIAQVFPIRVWRRADQVGPDGRIRPFFQPMPPPPSSPPPPPPHTPAPTPPESSCPHAPTAQHPAHISTIFPHSNTFNPESQNASIAAQLLGMSAVLARLTTAPANTQSPMPCNAKNMPDRSKPVPSNSSAVKPCNTPTNSPIASSAPRLVRIGRPPRASVITTIRRKSSRLAAKEDDNFAHASMKATRLKELKESLHGCSAAVKQEVQKKGLLSRSIAPIPIPALRKLVRAAGLGCSTANTVGVVPLAKE
jgi:hypothetical protein